MKSLWNYIYLLFSILLFTNLIILILNTNLNDDKQPFLERQLEENILLQVFNSKNIKIDENSSLKGINENLVLKDRINRNTLVLRFSEKTCNSCYESELKNLKKLPQYLKKKVIVLVSFSNFNDFVNLKESNNIDCPIFNIKKESLPEMELPYYFLLDNTFQLKLMYIPDNSLGNVTNLYFDKIFGLIDSESLNQNDISINKVKKSKVYFNTYVFDFGKIPQGDKTSTYFTLKNTGRAPLFISKITSSCGCTVPEWEKEPILPNKTSKIRVIYDGSIPGIFLKEIYVFTNTENSPTKLTIKGQIL